MNKTLSVKKQDIKKEWFVVDATDKVVGRLASNIAHYIRGKHKVYYTPNLDCGDNIIVVNADKIKFTGKKWTDKKYFSHTGYPGSQKRLNPNDLMKKDPKLILNSAVKGMLPKNKLGRQLLKNLHLYIGENHDYEAQKPKKIDI